MIVRLTNLEDEPLDWSRFHHSMCVWASDMKESSGWRSGGGSSTSLDAAPLSLSRSILTSASAAGQSWW